VRSHATGPARPRRRDAGGAVGRPARADRIPELGGLGRRGGGG
jgi:hypothetical protein